MRAARTASVTDSTGEVFTNVLDVAASEGTQLSLWTAVVAGGAGTKPTITVTPSASADVGVVAAEYSGLSTDGTGVDLTTTTTGATTTGGTVSSGSAGPAAGANELAVGLYADSGYGSTLTAGTGWTQRANISGASDLDLLLQDQVITAGASVASCRQKVMTIFSAAPGVWASVNASSAWAKSNRSLMIAPYSSGRATMWSVTSKISVG